MKKIILMTVTILVTVFIFAQEVTDTPALLNVNRYFPLFSIKKKEDIADNDYVWSSNETDYERFMALGGRENYIDTLDFEPVLKIV